MPLKRLRKSKSASWISEQIFQIEDSRQKKVQYINEKYAKENTPEYKASLIVRKAQQSEAKAKQKEKLSTYTELSNRSKNLSKAIIEDFKANFDSEKHEFYEFAQQLLTKYTDELQSIKEEAPFVEPPSQLSSKILNLYEDIYLALTQLDTRFLLLSPINIFSCPSLLRFDKFPSEDLPIMEKHLEEHNMFEDKTFLRYFGKYFPKYINKLRFDISDLSDIYFALRKDPTSFKLLDKDKQKALTEDQILFSTFKSIPKVFPYLSIKDLKRLKETIPSSFGTCLRNNPEFLDLLPQDFFNVKEIKYVFQTGSKKALKEIFSYRVDRHPAIVTYLNNQANPHTTYDV